MGSRPFRMIQGNSSTTRQNLCLSLRASSLVSEKMCRRSPLSEYRSSSPCLPSTIAFLGIYTTATATRRPLMCHVSSNCGRAQPCGTNGPRFYGWVMVQAIRGRSSAGVRPDPNPGLLTRGSLRGQHNGWDSRPLLWIGRFVAMMFHRMILQPGLEMGRAQCNDLSRGVMVVVSTA